MTKPSDFSPTEAIEVRSNTDSPDSRRVRWLLRAAGAAVLFIGWLAVAVRHIGQAEFAVTTVIFALMAVYAYAAAALSRKDAIQQERKLRLRLLVHNMELENLSMRDELTQIFNRRFLFERLQRELDTAKGFKRPLAYLAIEVGFLDHVNSAHGFAAGDRLLADFGGFLMNFSRVTDIPGRSGGSHFAVILPDTSKQGAYTMIDRLQRALAETQLADETESGAPVALFGVSGYPWGGDTLDDIVRQAEADLAGALAARDAGRAAPSDNGASEDDIPAAFRKLDEAPKGP
jgi:diguanylate cyclase (GGDEF)-like protein